MSIPQQILDVLACPQCKGDLDYNREGEKLTCNKCRLRFGILNGNVPNMLIDEAERV